MTDLTVLEVCAGGGGQALGLERAGFVPLGLVEIDADCCATLSRNRPDWQVMHDDITRLAAEAAKDLAYAYPADLVAAGLPCFAAGTMVLTTEGYKPIENVAVADLVLTHRGRWRPVTAVMTTPDAPLWQVKAGLPVTTTADHPFFTSEQSWVPGGREAGWHKVRQLAEPGWVPASELRPGTHRIGHVLPPSWPSRNSAAWWWLTGRYLADGWLTQRKKTGAGNPVRYDQGRVTIACGPGKEDELRKHLDLAGLHATESPERTSVKFHISHQGFYRFCRQFGHGAPNKRVPLAALSLPAGLAEELLSGWLAGDGFFEDLHAWSGTTTSKALALGMVLIAHRARGVMASVQACKHRPSSVIEGRAVNQRRQWRVDIPHRNRKHVVEGARAWRLITRSESLGARNTVYNLSVAGDESYIADGFVVHNCTPHTRGGRQLGEADERHLWDAALAIIARVLPRAVMLETSNAILTPRFSEERSRTLAALWDLEYLTYWDVIDCSQYGVPQRRRRAVLVAMAASEPRPAPWPQPDPEPPATVGDALLPLAAAAGWARAAAWAAGAQDVAPVVTGGSTKHGGADLGASQGKAAWRKLGIDPMGIADGPPGPDGKYPRGRGITGDAGETGLMLTVEMAARLQGFPPDWAFSGGKTARYRQVGNAFPPPAAASIGNAIRAALLPES